MEWTGEETHTLPATRNGPPDPYKIGREYISDDFKKKREKFLSGTENDALKSPVTKQSSVGLTSHSTSSSVADRRNKFNGNGNANNGNYNAQTFPKAAFNSQMAVRYDQNPTTQTVVREVPQRKVPEAPVNGRSWSNGNGHVHDTVRIERLYWTVSSFVLAKALHQYQREGSLRSLPNSYHSAKFMTEILPNVLHDYH